MVFYVVLARHLKRHFNNPQASNDSNSSSVPESRSDTDNNSGPDRRLDIGGDGERPGSPAPGPSRRIGKPVTTLNLVVLNNRLKKTEIDESLNKIRDFSNLESHIFTSESQRDSFDHDYTSKYDFIFIFFIRLI
jgi:hypothetical protein